MELHATEEVLFLTTPKEGEVMLWTKKDPFFGNIVWKLSNLSERKTTHYNKLPIVSFCLSKKCNAGDLIKQEGVKYLVFIIQNIVCHIQSCS